MQLSVLISLLPAVLAAPAEVARRAEPAPLLEPRGVKIIADKYIIKYKPGVARVATDASINAIEAKADYVYNTFNGFAGQLTTEEVETLRNRDDVSALELPKMVTRALGHLPPQMIHKLTSLAGRICREGRHVLHQCRR